MELALVIALGAWFHILVASPMTVFGVQSLFLFFMLFCSESVCVFVFELVLVFPWEIYGLLLFTSYQLCFGELIYTNEKLFTWSFHKVLTKLCLFMHLTLTHWSKIASRYISILYRWKYIYNKSNLLPEINSELSTFNYY